MKWLNNPITYNPINPYNDPYNVDPHDNNFPYGWVKAYKEAPPNMEDVNLKLTHKYLLIRLKE